MEAASEPEPVTEVQALETEAQDAETTVSPATDDDTAKAKGKQPAMLDKWKKWLSELMNDVTE